ncbi:MAG: FAD-dependent oxidoreductase [Bacteroidales bacterium]|nr:FAD-dependent oxidoreductase [Bacteroidales bacterium]MBR1794348.1 FAD-dependent oxidoreductase [Bacteroidales bacterium]
MKNNEALRCLLCKKPKCSLQGCPVHTPIPQCMQLYREDKLDEAGKILFDNNPLSAITSRVCDWRQFCFGNCILNVKKIPVRWYEIEQEISDAYLFSVTLKRESDLLAGKRVALIGAGPVGIVAAIWLYRLGAEVSIADSNPRIGGVLRYGIPGFRLDKKYVNAYERLLLGAGIEFQGGIEVGRDIELARVAARYDAVLIGTGAEKAALLNIPGEGKGLQALPFLKNPEAFDLGKRVIVIGGGNVAMDASRTAVRHGAETWIYYRKDYGNMPANPIEVEEAMRDGVHFRVFQAPVEVRTGSVVFCDCENVTDPETGKVRTRIIEGTEHEVECDTLLSAISEKPDFSVFNGCVPLLNEKGDLIVNEDGLAGIEGIDNVYVAGDFLFGPKTVVEAVASARKAVDAIIARFGQKAEGE